MASVVFVGGMMVFSDKGQAETQEKSFETVLTEKGVPVQKVKELGNDINVVENVYKQRELSSDQLNSFVNSLTDKTDSTKETSFSEASQTKRSVPLPSSPLREQEKKQKNPLQARTLQAAPSVTSSGYQVETGASFDTMSTGGFSSATGFVTLPVVSSKGGDVPYILAGIYRTDNRGGADMGLFYKDGVWTASISSTDTSWNHTCPNNTCGWTQGNVGFTRDQHMEVYMMWKAKQNLLELTVLDAKTWEKITAISQYNPHLGLNENGTGLKIYKGMSIASVAKDLTNDSYLLYGKWRDTYLYNPNQTQLWTSDFVSSRSANKTADEKRTVVVPDVLNKPAYQEEISIRYNLPKK